MSTIIPDNPSPQLFAALKWVDGFNKWQSADDILSVAADDYMHYLLPQSLGIAPKNKEEFREYFTKVLKMFKSFKITIHDIVEGPNKIFFHATSKGMSLTDVPYANEYNVTLHFTTQVDGTPKISVAKEFVDSKYTNEYFDREGTRQATEVMEGSITV